MSRLCRGALVAVFVLFLSSCGTDEGFTTVAIPAGYLRIVNTIPDSPALNTYVDGRFQQRVSFGTSTSFLEVLPALPLAFTVDYVQGGALVPLITDAPLYIDIDHEATVFITGTMASPQIVVAGNAPIGTTAPLEQLEVQFGHFAVGSQAPVRVVLNLGGSVVSDTTLTFAEVTDLAIINPGDYTIDVYDSASNTLLWQSGDFTLSAGIRGIFALEDYFGPGAAKVRLVSISAVTTSRFPNENLPSEVRIANMTPDLGPLDVYIDGALVQSNMPFGQVSAYQSVTSGAFVMTVRPFGDTTTTISENSTSSFSPGTYHTVALTGLTGVGVSQLYFDNVRRIASRATLFATNTAPSFGSFDVYLLDPGTSVTDFTPRLNGIAQIPSANSSQGFTTEAGSYDLVITSFGDKTVLYGPLRVDLNGSGIYSLFITDTTGGGTPIEVVFADDFI